MNFENKEIDKNCAYETYGRKCGLPGVASPNVYGNGPFYCRWHYAVLFGGVENNKENFEKYKKNEEAYRNSISSEKYRENNIGLRGITYPEVVGARTSWGGEDETI